MAAQKVASWQFARAAAPSVIEDPAERTRDGARPLCSGLSEVEGTDQVVKAPPAGILPTHGRTPHGRTVEATGPRVHGGRPGSSVRRPQRPSAERATDGRAELRRAVGEVLGEAARLYESFVADADLTVGSCDLAACVGGQAEQAARGGAHSPSLVRRRLWLRPRGEWTIRKTFCSRRAFSNR